MELDSRLWASVWGLKLPPVLILSVLLQNFASHPEKDVTGFKVPVKWTLCVHMRQLELMVKCFWSSARCKSVGSHTCKAWLLIEVKTCISQFSLEEPHGLSLIIDHNVRWEELFVLFYSIVAFVIEIHFQLCSEAFCFTLTSKSFLVKHKLFSSVCKWLIQCSSNSIHNKHFMHSSKHWQQNYWII